MQFGQYQIQLLQSHQDLSFFNLIEKNRVRLEDFFAGTVIKTKTLEDSIKYVNEIVQCSLDKTYFAFMITDTKTNDFIGLVDVKNIDWNVPKAELGSFIDRNYEGKGIITKATGLVVAYLVDTYKFKKLLCRANSRNLGSIGVILKNCFELEGTIRNDYRTTKGEIVDLNYYGRVF